MNELLRPSRPVAGFLISLLLALTGVLARAEEAALRWVANGGLTPQAEALLVAMRQAEDFGLSPRDFDSSLAAIDAKRAARDTRALDELVTAAATRLVRQLHDGRVTPRAAGYALKRQRSPIDVNETLRRLATAPDVPTALAALEPKSSQYHTLKHALARYRAIRETGDLPAPRRAIHAGDEYAESAKLRALLAEFGDAPAPGSSPDEGASDSLYDEALADAVTRFQQRHGLTADGVLGPKTFAALSVPVAKRIRQIELTMERWRWMPDLEPPAVIVNVPQFMLYALPRARDYTPDQILKTPVIVGKSSTQTPIFDSQIEAVVIRPYWNVPTSILRGEILPKIARDENYLARNDMEIVVGYGDGARVLPPNAEGIEALRTGKARLRQRPGPQNSLGLIKFELPNPYSVYLHSTPEARLFERDRRAFSHGCVRVSDSMTLAAYLLADTDGDWDIANIEAATCGERTFTVKIAKPVPVFILYGTVVVDTDGSLLFFDDVYGHDRKLEQLLARAAK